MSENRGCGCWKIGGVGCAAVVILAVLAAVIVGFNFDRIRESELGRRIADAAGEAKESIGELLALRSDVVVEFEMDGCEINLNTTRSSGRAVKTLELKLINPVVPEDDEAEEYARSVARFAAERFASIESADYVQITIARQLRAGVRFSASTNYRFPVAELRPPSPEQPPTPEAPPTEAPSTL